MTMSNNLLFITMVAMTVFNVSAYVFIMVRFTEIQNQIKDLADNQFDAEQVMEVFNQKYHRPIVYEDKKQIRELYEPIIFESKNKIFELEKKVDFLENENIRLKRMLEDKLVDIEMDIHMLKTKIRS